MAHDTGAKPEETTPPPAEPEVVESNSSGYGAGSLPEEPLEERVLHERPK